MNKYFVLSTLLFFGVASADINKRIVELKATKESSVANQFQKEVVSSKTPTVVLFSATWCGPCKIFKPTFEQLALSYGADKVKFVYVDTDAFPEHRSKYGVRTVPTIKYFKDGKDLGASETDRSLSSLKNEIKNKFGVC